MLWSLIIRMVILISMIHHCSADGYKVFLNSSLIPGLGRSAREGIDYPLQYSWASLVAQLVKNPPALQETWFGKISWRRERLPTPVFWCGEFHGLYCPWGHKESHTTEWLSHSHSFTFTESFSTFGCKVYNHSDIGIDHLVMAVCRIVSCVVGRWCLL